MRLLVGSGPSRVLLVVLVVGGCGTLVRLEPPPPEGELPPEGCAGDEDCDDGIACTDDGCKDGACVHDPLDERCDDDGDPCNGESVCDPESGGCTETGFPCDDGASCTEDSCVLSPDGHRCLALPDHRECPRGELCTRQGETWGCGPVECPPGGCDDGIACNGLERCSDDGNRCVPGEFRACDDGLRCTGDEFCDESGECRSQPPPLCDDGVDCTLDTCDPGVDDCLHGPVDLACESGSACEVGLCTADGCDREPFECNDGNDCTIDSCADEEGGCFSEAPDVDDDGYGDLRCAQGEGDCDDRDPEVHPGADEQCNGKDDDCDGMPDDGLCAPGEFQQCDIDPDANCMGYQVCDDACTYGACLALAENCGDGLDNDCDGQHDEGCACDPDGAVQQDCIAPCGAPGLRTCEEGEWGPCVPGTELCNGFDDDCDGAADETFDCRAGDVLACDPLGGGQCGEIGVQTCDATCTLSACVAPVELCNGGDDDCDGEVDEGYQCVAGDVTACNTGCGGDPGTQTCSAQCFLGACKAPAEACNGADDDCNLLCDDGFACCAGRSSVCQTSCNSGGTSLCADDCTQGGCTEPAEVCNGIDDDCSGACDDGELCCAYVDDQPCTTDGGIPGHEICDGSCTWGKCCADAEVCNNGFDDDCDGETDPIVCCAALGDTDVCNGLDDDCNGVTDDQDECGVGETDVCLVPGCNVIGERTCSIACAWGACEPRVQREAGVACRNGVDDDCDGAADGADADCPQIIAN